MASDPAEAIALHRFSVIAEATNPRLSPAERGRVVRDLARRVHVGPDGPAGPTPGPPSTAGSAPGGPGG
jgi:hypothetical protein